MSWEPHDPQAVLDYTIDWTPWLQADETITTASWDIPDGVTKPSAKPSTIEGGKCIVWLTGGTAGQDYDCTVHIVTSMGREDERTETLAVRHR